MAWLALHDGLTMKFLKGRDITRSGRCPRVGCGGTEDVEHVFWECNYAMEVRRCFELLVDKVCKSKLSYASLLTGAGLGMVEGVCLGWIFCFVFKEVLWDMRNQFVVRKEELEVKYCCKMILMKLHTIFLYHVKKLGEDVSRRIWRRNLWSTFVKVGVG